MAKKKDTKVAVAKPSNGDPAVSPGAVNDYRHKGAKRKNNPPAKIAAEGTVPAIPKAEYAYNPHLPPVLRFDVNGSPDKLPALLEKAGREKLTADEVRLLAAALRRQEPWLEWAGKRESQAKGFTVDPVALHIHERISTQAILKVAARQDVEKSLFGGGADQAYHEAVQFYRHDIDWTNRMILGDSLEVMSSLAKREDLAGKVQMIYMDPPYGIKFASNFQPEIGQRDVKDKEQDLTREPEVVKAYRDTYRLGIHSYLAYLRDRLIVAKELLTDTGSIFVQIGDENLHRVRALLDEVFGASNAITQIVVRKTTGSTADFISGSCDYLLWYGRNREATRFQPLFLQKNPGDEGATGYSKLELPNGERRPLRTAEATNLDSLPKGADVFAGDNVTSQSMGREKGEGAASWFKIRVDGTDFTPGPKARWKTNEAGMTRLLMAERLIGGERSTLSYKRKLNDFPVSPLGSVWTDTVGQNQLGGEKVYIVQTALKIVERCMLMTTVPGDLVLDPTCGSGTTAVVAEEWGRRWITTDTSRVAIAIARQRLLTAKFDYNKLRDESKGLAGGLVYKTVPHVTLKSIAQNVALDPIFSKYEPMLDVKLKDANAALVKVDAAARAKLLSKLTTKQKAEGKKAVTDADRRRWDLPAKGQTWEHWTIPFDADDDYPKLLADAVTAYRAAWRAKMDEVNACIAASAEQEELVDQPQVVRGVVRVSGPFTVEGVQPPEMSLSDVMAVGGDGAADEQAGFDGAPEEVGPTFAMRPVVSGVGETAQDVSAYLDKMIRLLRGDGVRFPNNKQMTFIRLEPIFETRGSGGFHAEGRWVSAGEADPDPQGSSTVGVVIGPQYGPVTAKMVEDLIRPASRRYEDLVIAGFSFTGEAQAIISENPHPKLRIHVAHIRPDVNPGMDGLLKETPNSQLFTVFGQPRISVVGPDSDGVYVVTMEGVDIYNPVDNTISATGADKVAAWFVDGDYDGRTFCVTQAFFPDRSAWEKLAKALGGVVDPERFEALSGTTSLPFPAGKHKTVAVKVIDPRGNEVMSVHQLS